MQILSLIFTFIKVLPELFKLVRTLEQKADVRKRENLVKEDMGLIARAFDNGDAEMLNRIFNNEKA